MKRIPAFCMLLFYSMSLSAQQVITTEEANNSKGTIFEEAVKLRGQLFSGIIKDSYPNGLPKAWLEVKEGRANGEWIEWYPNGNFRFKSFWKDGKGHGPWQYFYESGKLRQDEFVINDNYNGCAKVFFENGQLKKETYYINNQKVGYEYLYSKDGSLEATNKYEEGILLNDRPRKFALGKISTDNYNEWGITFLPDGQTAYFTRRMKDEKQQIYKSIKQQNGEWGAAAISEISQDRDEAIFYSPANQCFYFATTKKEATNAGAVEGDMNIWSRTLDGQYTQLAFNKNRKPGDTWPNYYETGPVTDTNGDIYFWSGSEKGDDADLYWSKKVEGFKRAKPLSKTINTNKYESSPCISPDGKYLLFSSYQRDDGLGEEDIYYSKKVNGEWSTPKSLGLIVNTKYNESFSGFSPDGQQFYFCSDRDGKWSVYFIDTKYLRLD